MEKERVRDPACRETGDITAGTVVMCATCGGTAKLVLKADSEDEGGSAREDVDVVRDEDDSGGTSGDCWERGGRTAGAASVCSRPRFVVRGPSLSAAAVVVPRLVDSVGGGGALKCSSSSIGGGVGDAVGGCGRGASGSAIIVAAIARLAAATAATSAKDDGAVRGRDVAKVSGASTRVPP